MVHAAHVGDGTGGNIVDEDILLVMGLPLDQVGVDGPWGLLGMRRGWWMVASSRPRRSRAGRYWEGGGECVAGREANGDAVLDHVLERGKSQEMQAVVRFRGIGGDRAMFEELLDAAFDEPSDLGGQGAVLVDEPAELGLEAAGGQEGGPLLDGCHDGRSGAEDHGTDAGEIGEVRAEVDEGGRSDVEHLREATDVFVGQAFGRIL